MINLIKQLAAGKFDDRFAIKLKDEIGEMGVAVNNLVDSLQAVLRDIADTMGAVEKGDLSKLIMAELKGELDRNKSRINRSIAMLSATVATVLQSSDSVQTSAKELSGSASALSTSTARKAATLDEISSSIAEINSGIGQVNETVQQNSAVSEETASASDLLLNQSNALQQELGRFTLLETAMESVTEIEFTESNRHIRIE